MRATKDHNIVSMSELKSQGASALKGKTEEIRCEDHPKESIRLYCEDCDKLICRDCVLLSHKYAQNERERERDLTQS